VTDVLRSGTAWAQKLILASDSTRTLGKSRAAHPPLRRRDHLCRL